MCNVNVSLFGPIFVPQECARNSHDKMVIYGPVAASVNLNLKTLNTFKRDLKIGSQSILYISVFCLVFFFF